MALLVQKEPSTNETGEKIMFNSKTQLLEWHQKGIINTLNTAVYMAVKYHCSPVEIFKTLKLRKLLGW